VSLALKEGGAVVVPKPLYGAVALMILLVSPTLRASGPLAASVALAAVLVAVLGGWVTARAAATGRRLRLQPSARPEHLLPALAQVAVLVYWSQYWEPLGQGAVLIAAQIVLAYTLDMLLVWSRRDTYALGVGPASTVLCINLFLRFHDDWFFLQLLMVAMAAIAPHVLRWERGDGRAPIFNAAGLALSAFSLGLVLLRTAHVTWGAEMAATLLFPPHVYLFAFAVTLPGLFVNRTVGTALAATVTVCGLSTLVLRGTGSYFFVDSTIPIAVFLFAQLVLAEPVTAPRSELGRLVFGGLYGLSVFLLHGLLVRLEFPAFVAPLLPLPLLNLLVPVIDWLARARPISWLDPGRVGSTASPSTRSLIYVLIWISVFGGLSAAKAVGDAHPGRTVQFWQQACRDERPLACLHLGDLLKEYCALESGWACNELGILTTSGRLKAAPMPSEFFTKACGFGQRAGCDNARKLSEGGRDFVHGDPTVLDFPRLLRQGKGPIAEKTSLQILTRACDDGWMSGCDGLTAIYFRGIPGLKPDKARAAALALKGCEGGYGRSCSNLGLMYKNGDGVPQDAAKALIYLKKSCDLGFQDGCRWLAEEPVR
jgi:hypothetical protein